MNSRIISITIFGIALLNIACTHMNAESPSEFDELAIRTMQAASSASSPSPAFNAAAQAFQASNDPVIKAAKWEELINATAGGLLSATWTAPSGGWKLVEFPTTGNLTLEDVRDQQSDKTLYRKLIAQDETQAVQFRGAQGLFSIATFDGEQWGEKLILDIAQRPDGNLKRMAFWFAHDFAGNWHANAQSESGGPCAVPVWAI